MTVRNLFHRVNRGIVLAVVLLIGLVSYIIIDNAGFDKERTVIKDMVTAYAKEAEGLMTLPEDVRKPGQKAPKSAVEEKSKENEAIINKYFLNKSISRYNGPANENLMLFLDSAYEFNNEKGWYVTNCKYENLNITKLKKQGMVMAVGDVEVKVMVEAVGKPMYMALFSTWDGTGESIEDTKQAIDTKQRTCTGKFTFNDVVFKKVNGTWKVAEISGYGTDGGSY